MPNAMQVNTNKQRAATTINLSAWIDFMWSPPFWRSVSEPLYIPRCLIYFSEL
jgi:hypothetical protein